MPLIFAIIAALTIVSAIAAVSLRNLVHCALSLIVTFCGLACLYLQLHAQFVGWVQVLVYIGAVATLIVFAILLTGNSARTQGTPILAPAWWVGLGAALLVAGTLVTAIHRSSALSRNTPPAAETSTRQIGEELMTRYVLPLEVVGLLLTAAMLGAVIIAMQDRRPGSTPPSQENAG